MKRILLMMFAFAFCLMANAEITNTIWGLTLGKSGRIQVTNAIKAHHLEIMEKKNELISCSSSGFKFGGETWDYADFGFFDRTLSEISFACSSVTSAYVKESFDRLADKLRSKYASYIVEEDLSTYDHKVLKFDDGVNMLWLSYNREDGLEMVSISYYNNELLIKQYDKNASEL